MIESWQKKGHFRRHQENKRKTRINEFYVEVWRLPESPAGMLVLPVLVALAAVAGVEDHVSAGVV